MVYATAMFRYITFCKHTRKEFINTEDRMMRVDWHGI